LGEDVRRTGEGKSLSKTQNSPTSFKREEGKKAAFTLAEVLITLGIIGIVAAMTIPTLMGNYQKKATETRLKATYSILANAVRLVEEEYGTGYDMTEGLSNLSWNPTNSATVFNKYLAPHLKVNFQYPQADCEKLVVAHPYSNMSASYTDYNAACYNLMNGTSIAFWAGKSSSDTDTTFPIAIYPNPQKTTKILGKDAFAIYIYSNYKGLNLGTITDFRYPELTREEIKKYCNANSGRVSLKGYSASTGSFCIQLIRDSSWTIPADYPIKF
jgi:prepilin-type N-terminal cleavage/methylation domain-containing protein